MKKIFNLLGIDWGEKRIGIATGDSDTCLALPFKTVATLSELKGVIKEEETEIIVLGSPDKMSGVKANNPKWLNFLNKLRSETDCVVEVFDERLSSLAGDALEGTKNQKAGRDEIAAAIILQDYLEKNCSKYGR
ncbi:MAG: Holliday junction resolvase RuvX [Patescibacteria group bacterium]|jgi:putative Holliday junction resolvase|nr:Holliday junction resolvase RuvX [Patescibacteria group bacterium]